MYTSSLRQRYKTTLTSLCVRVWSLSPYYMEHVIRSRGTILTNQRAEYGRHWPIREQSMASLASLDVSNGTWPVEERERRESIERRDVPRK